MFTGIVEETARLRDRADRRLTFEASVVLDGLRVGDSIAHNGCCLTVVRVDEGSYDVDVVDETLARTNLGDLQVGDRVNVERPVLAGGRLDGHIVQGHVDAVGEVVDPAPEMRVRMPDDLLRYVVEKGSVTVDGCALTVVKPLPDGFTVAVIPHTAAVTTLGQRTRGDRVNLEVDILAKYIERLLADQQGRT